MQHYIGITDFTSPDEVRRIIRVPTDRALDTKMDHVLGVGVMMSYKTLHDLPTKWASAWPSKDKIADIFMPSDSIYDTHFNILHYADYDAVTTPEDLKKAVSYGGPNLHALQLDMVWPDMNILLSDFWSVRNRLKIILQVGERAMVAAGDDPKTVVSRLWDYVVSGCIDYVLFDRSMGRGKGMDAELLLAYYRAVREKFHREELGIVVAGGLGPETMSLLDPFRRENIFNDISIDAQGQLRKSGNALEPIEWGRAEEYFAQACMFFGWM